MLINKLLVHVVFDIKPPYSAKRHIFQQVVATTINPILITIVHQLGAHLSESFQFVLFLSLSSLEGEGGRFYNENCVNIQHNKPIVSQLRYLNRELKLNNIPLLFIVRNWTWKAWIFTFGRIQNGNRNKFVLQLNKRLDISIHILSINSRNSIDKCNTRECFIYGHTSYFLVYYHFHIFNENCHWHYV